MRKVGDPIEVSACEQNPEEEKIEERAFKKAARPHHPFL